MADRLKILTAAIVLIVSTNAFSQGKFSESVLSRSTAEIEDSASVTLDILVDKSGAPIAVTYLKEKSTTENEKMINIARKRVMQIKFPAQPTAYKTTLTFHFRKGDTD